MGEPVLDLILRSGFSIAKLPGLALWLPADQNNLYSDAGVTPATADGTAIQQANDRSGRGNTHSQATAGLRPLLKTGANGINGRSVILLDGTDDYLGGTIPVPAGANGMTLLAAFKTGGSIPSTPALFSSGGTGATTGARWAFGLGSDTTFGMGWGGPAAGVGLGSGAGVAINTVYVCSWRTNRAAWVVRRNGAQIAAPADTSFPSGTWASFIGVEGAGSFPQNGSLLELLVCFADIGASNLGKAEQYLAQRAGVVLP